MSLNNETNDHTLANGVGQRNLIAVSLKLSLIAALGFVPRVYHVIRILSGSNNFTPNGNLRVFSQS